MYADPDAEQLDIVSFGQIVWPKSHIPMTLNSSRKLGRKVRVVLDSSCEKILIACYIRIILKTKFGEVVRICLRTKHHLPCFVAILATLYHQIANPWRKIPDTRHSRGATPAADS